MSEQMQRTIKCKECGEDFVYDYVIDEVHGFRGVYNKRYCNKCTALRKVVKSREAQRVVYAKRTPKPKKATKQSVTKFALKYIKELYRYYDFEFGSTVMYDYLETIMPTGFISRDALRRCNKELNDETKV